MGSDIVDDFLFQTRSGFCAHYAGAMTFVLRAAGIPARVVAGYRAARSILRATTFRCISSMPMPGSNTGSPSAAGSVSTRLSRSRPSASSRDWNKPWRGSGAFADEPLSLLRFRDVGWMNTLRLRWDSLNYGWQRWVLNYQDEQQSQMLQRWFGKLDGQALGLGLVAVLGLLTGILALVLFKPWRRGKDVQQRQFDRFERLLARQGIRRHKGEGHAASPSGPLPKCPIRRQQSAHSSGCTRRSVTRSCPGRRGAVARLTNVRRAMPWRIAAPRRHS